MMRSNPQDRPRKIAPWLSSSDLVKNRPTEGQTISQPIPQVVSRSAGVHSNVPNESILTHSATSSHSHAPSISAGNVDDPPKVYHASNTFTGLFDSVYKEAMKAAPDGVSQTIETIERPPRRDNASDDSTFTFRGMTSCSIEENDEAKFEISPLTSTDAKSTPLPSNIPFLGGQRNIQYNGSPGNLGFNNLDPSSNQKPPSIRKMSSLIGETSSYMNMNINNRDIYSATNVKESSPLDSKKHNVNVNSYTENNQKVGYTANELYLNNTVREDENMSQNMPVTSGKKSPRPNISIPKPIQIASRANVYTHSENHEISKIGSIANPTGEIHYISSMTAETKSGSPLQQLDNENKYIYEQETVINKSDKNTEINKVSDKNTETDSELSQDTDSENNNYSTSDGLVIGKNPITNTGSSMNDSDERQNSPLLPPHDDMEYREVPDTQRSGLEIDDICKEFWDGLLDFISVKYDNPLDDTTWAEAKAMKERRTDNCYLTSNYGSVMEKAEETLVQYKLLRDQERSFFSTKNSHQAAIASDPLYFLVYSYYEAKNVIYIPPEDATYSNGIRHMYTNEETWNGEEISSVQFFHSHLKSYMPNASEILSVSAALHSAESERLTSNHEMSLLNRSMMLRILYMAKFNFDTATTYYHRSVIWRNLMLPIVLSRSEWRLATTAISSRPLLACIYPVGRDKQARPIIVIRLLPIIKIHNKLVNTAEYDDFLSCLKKLLVFWFEFAVSFLMSPNTIEQFNILVDFCQNMIDVETVREYSSTLLWLYSMMTELRLQYSTRINKIFLMNFHSDAMNELQLRLNTMSVSEKVYMEVEENYVRNNEETVHITDLIGLSQLETSYGGARKAFYDWKPLFRFVKAFCVSHKVFDIDRRFHNVLEKTAQLIEGRRNKISLRGFFKSAFGK